MKKAKIFTALFLALAMILACLVGCDFDLPEQTETTSSIDGSKTKPYEETTWYVAEVLSIKRDSQYLWLNFDNLTCYYYTSSKGRDSHSVFRNIKKGIIIGDDLSSFVLQFEDSSTYNAKVETVENKDGKKQTITVINNADDNDWEKYDIYQTLSLIEGVFDYRMVQIQESLNDLDYFDYVFKFRGFQIIEFGQYNINSLESKENMRWIVAEVNDDECLLVSEFAIRCLATSDVATELIKIENDMFSDQEKQAIINKSDENNSTGGCLFELDKDQMARIFPYIVGDEKKTTLTPYACSEKEAITKDKSTDIEYVELRPALNVSRSELNMEITDFESYDEAVENNRPITTLLYKLVNLPDWGYDIEFIDNSQKSYKYFVDFDRSAMTTVYEYYGKHGVYRHSVKTNSIIIVDDHTWQIDEYLYKIEEVDGNTKVIETNLSGKIEYHTFLVEENIRTYPINKNWNDDSTYSAAKCLFPSE